MRNYCCHINLIFLFSVIGLVASCSLNPVTGKNQVSLLSERQELSLGEENYLANQQAQGGLYIVDPRLNSYVNRIGQSLARVSDRPNLPYEFVVINNDSANAWALPGGKIAINRGLLMLLKDEAQLAAVLGHEIVHAAARHGANQMSRSILLQLGKSVVDHYTNGGYMTLANYGVAAFQARYSRSQEFEADHYGMDYMVKVGYDPMAAVELQQTFVELSQSRGSQNNWLNTLFASHPPSQARVTANRIRANSLPPGERNQRAYQRAIRQIIRDKDAYKTHQKAITAANKKQWRQAISLTNKATDMQPKEALFWLTRARLSERNNSKKNAFNFYNKAIRLNGNYFAGYLYRGLLHYKMSLYTEARNDLIASNRLLETQPANFYLGEIALNNDQKQTAIDYYKKVSSGGGDLRQTALKRLRDLTSAGL